MSEGWKERRRGIIKGFLHNKLKVPDDQVETRVYPRSVTLTVEAFRGKGVSLGQYRVPSDGITPMVDLIENILPGHGYPASNDNWTLDDAALQANVRAAPTKPAPAPRKPKRRVAPPGTVRPLRQPSPGSRDDKVLASVRESKGPSCPVHRELMRLDTERNVWRCTSVGCKKVAFPKNEEAGDSWKHTMKIITGDLTIVKAEGHLYLRTKLNHLIDITPYVSEHAHSVDGDAFKLHNLPVLNVDMLQGTE